MVDNEGQRAFVWNRSGAGDLQPVGYGELPGGVQTGGVAPGKLAGGARPCRSRFPIFGG